IVDHFYPNLGITETMYCLIFLVPLLIFTQIKNLKFLAPFSGFANVLLVLTFIICLYYICDEFPDIDSRPMSVDVGKLPLFIGMAKPQHFLGCPGVLNITMTVVVLLYMLMGFLGYVRYGDTAVGSITLNLPTGEFYVPMEIVWRNTKEHVTQKYHNLAQGIMRAVFAVLTVAAAATLPKLEQVIGLEGAFFYSFLGLIAPSILDLIFSWERDLGRFKWIMWKDIVLILFGSFVLVAGVTQMAAAATLPKLEQVIGLEGAFFYSFLGLIAPSILDLIFSWERDLGMFKWIMWKDIVLILFGSFVLVAGVTQSIREIVKLNE
ncbi:Amino acid transporter, partial [Operophtera brumata]